MLPPLLQHLRLGSTSDSPASHVLAGHDERVIRKLLAAPGHVVDKGSIDVGASGTDPIQQSFEVGHEVLSVWKFFVDDLSITGITQHHQASRNPYRFSPDTPGHCSYTDPF